MRISDWSSDVCSSDLAWMGFTLPSALLMLGFALVAKDLSGPVAISAIHGLKIAAVAIVAQALIGMARKLTPDVPRIAMANVSAALMLIISVRSEEHTSELQSLMRISYAVFCLKKKRNTQKI